MSVISVKIRLEEYAITPDYLEVIAGDFFGRLLATTEEDTTFDFGFEGDQELLDIENASRGEDQKITLEAMARLHAMAFKKILNSPTWKLS